MNGELVGDISFQIAKTIASINPETGIVLVMDNATEFEFYSTLHEMGSPQPAYNEKGERNPYMSADIVVSRDVEGWQLMTPLEKIK